jgi:hypothetical protein
MKSKKIMIICLVAVLALAMMGFGFAKWSDYVKFEGSVATGNVGVNIEAGETTDLGADPNYPPGDNWEGKDVASCTVTTECNTTLVVNIENAYPWYKPGFSFRINGLGTVPVKVEELKILACQDPKGLGNFIKVADWEIHVVNPESHGLAAEDRTIASDSSNASWEGLANALKYIQLHKDGYIDVSVNLYIQETIGCGCNKRIAPQDANFYGLVKLIFSQWNEVGPGPNA